MWNSLGHRPGDPDEKVWQHDLYHPDFTAYDPSELQILKATIKQSQTKEYLNK